MITMITNNYIVCFYFSLCVMGRVLPWQSDFDIPDRVDGPNIAIPGQSRTTAVPLQLQSDHQNDHTDLRLLACKIQKVTHIFVANQLPRNMTEPDGFLVAEQETLSTVQH